MSRLLASHSWLVAPHDVIPCPPSTTPIARGLSALTRAMSSASWKPGRRHGTHATRSPNAARVSASPSAAVARAIPASGCRWSTCGASTRACMAVSMDGAAPPLPCRQKSNASTISSSRSTPGYTSTRARSRSRRSTASPEGVSVPRSPPDPLTQTRSTGSPVTGSVSVPLALVLPPAKLVVVGSAPRRLERATRSATAGFWVLMRRSSGRGGRVGSGPGRRGAGAQAPQPACVPPTRSASTRSW
jgi:hypothetical protein